MVWGHLVRAGDAREEAGVCTPASLMSVRLTRTRSARPDRPPRGRALDSPDGRTTGVTRPIVTTRTCPGPGTVSGASPIRSRPGASGSTTSARTGLPASLHRATGIDPTDDMLNVAGPLVQCYQHQCGPPFRAPLRVPLR